MITGNRESSERDETTWSLSYQWTLKVREQYANIWSLPLRSGLLNILNDHIHGSKLLDVGASEMNSLRAGIRKIAPDAEYKTFDVDRRTKQDYYSWSDVNENFDTVLCSEVIEHINFENGLQLFRDVYDKLSPGGVFVVTTPSIHHPTRIHEDPTHVTWWCYDHLGGELLRTGFDLIAFYRYGAPGREKRLKARIMGKIMERIRRNMGLDNAKSICAVGRKPE